MAGSKISYDTLYEKGLINTLGDFLVCYDTGSSSFEVFDTLSDQDPSEVEYARSYYIELPYKSDYVACAKHIRSRNQNAYSWDAALDLAAFYVISAWERENAVYPNWVNASL